MTSGFGRGVHTNCGIPSKALYLLANGGQHHGREVESIGRAKAWPVFFQTMRRDLLYVATSSLVRDLTVHRASIYAHPEAVYDCWPPGAGPMLGFRPDADFHYRAPGTDTVPFQGSRYFLQAPASASGGAYELTFTIETTME